MSELTGKDEVRRLSAREKRRKLICGSDKKANTQLAIDTAAVRDQPVNACKRNSKKVEKKRTVKQMKLKLKLKWRGGIISVRH